jgi:2-iminobutanoate/2-iminopropanoate deaminase
MRDIVSTDHGPKPIGPYSQAVKANGLVYVSGQLGLDPKTGEMVAGGVAEQTDRVMNNLKGIVEAAGSKLSHAVKTTIYLKDLNDFAAMNEVYGKFFIAAPPARSTVQVARLPKDALVEIDIIAVL